MASFNLVHFTPADVQREQAYVAAIAPCFREIQAWLSVQLGGPTFSFAEPVVVTGLEPAAFYAPPDSPNVGLAVWGSVLQEIAARGIAPDSCSPPYHVLAVFTRGLPGNGGTPCGGFTHPKTGLWPYAGDGGGLAMFPEESLHAFMGREHPWFENTGWIIAEAVMHGLTIPHPRVCEVGVGAEISSYDGQPLRAVDCAKALNWSQHAYPNVVLLDDVQNPEKLTLQGHRLIDLPGVPGATEPPAEPPMPPVEPPTEPPPEPEEPKPAKRDKPPRGGWGRGGRPR